MPVETLSTTAPKPPEEHQEQLQVPNRPTVISTFKPDNANPDMPDLLTLRSVIGFPNDKTLTLTGLERVVATHLTDSGGSVAIDDIYQQLRRCGETRSLPPKVYSIIARINVKSEDIRAGFRIQKRDIGDENGALIQEIGWQQVDEDGIKKDLAKYRESAKIISCPHQENPSLHWFIVQNPEGEETKPFLLTAYEGKLLLAINRIPKTREGLESAMVALYESVFDNPVRFVEIFNFLSNKLAAHELGIVEDAEDNSLSIKSVNPNSKPYRIAPRDILAEDVAINELSGDKQRRRGPSHGMLSLR